MDVSFLFAFAFLFSSFLSKVSSDNHFAFLHFFFLGMVLITTSYRKLRTFIHSPSESLSGDIGQAETSLMPDIDGTGSSFLLDSILSTVLKKLSSDVWVVTILFIYFFHHVWPGGSGLPSEWLLEPFCTVLHFGPVPQKLTVLPQRKKISLSFLVLWMSLVFQLLLTVVSFYHFSGSPILSGLH